MATSSIHIETSSAGALIHNERVFSPDYLITNDKSVNDKKHYDNVHISELEKLAKIDYQTHSTNNRKLPKTATLIKEAVINLEAHHNLNDLEKVKDTLENEYGYKITDISIHRDEGYIFTETKNYIMGRNQYKNLDETPHIAELDKDNKFYEWTLQNNNWIKGDEIKDYKINHNYHAHIVMLNYDFSKHRTIRNNLKDLSKMQTLVARDLSMERGKCSSTVEAQRIGVEVEQSRKRINIKEYKVQKRKEKELEKELEKEKKKNINLEKELYNFREMQKTITALELTSDEKKELHRLNSQVKNQAATIEQLNKKIEELTVTNTYRLDKLVLKQKEINDLKALTTSNEEVNILKNENKSLQEQNNTLVDENLDLKKKIVSSATIIATLEQKLKDIVSLVNNKIKSLFQYKVLNDYNLKKSRDWKTYINTERDDYWNEIVYYNSKEIDDNYKKNLDMELIKIDDLIPGEKETPNYSKMKLEEILKSPIKKEDLKEAQDNLKEMLEENKETVVYIRKNF